MSYHKILVPFDDSFHVNKALSIAVEMAKYVNPSEVVLLYVVYEILLPRTIIGLKAIPSLYYYICRPFNPCSSTQFKILQQRERKPNAFQSYNSTTQLIIIEHEYVNVVYLFIYLYKIICKSLLNYEVIYPLTLLPGTQTGCKIIEKPQRLSNLLVPYSMIETKFFLGHGTICQDDF